MKKNIFHSLDEEILKQGMKICFENSKSHFSCSEQLEKIKEYGIACSHLILSVEEAIKGLVIYLKLVGPDMDNENIEPYFTKHTPKHTVAKDIYVRIKYLKKTLEEIESEGAKLKLECLNNKITREEFDLKVSQLIKLKSQEVWLREARKDMDGEKKERNFWNKADDLKNHGFYVSYRQNKWQYPNQTTPEQYFSTKEIAKNIVMTIYDVHGKADIEKVKQNNKREAMNYKELYNTAPNGMKIDKVLIYEVSNLDGSGIDYKAVYEDFIDNKQIVIGTVNLTLGDISFEETKSGVGVPHTAIKLFLNWIEENLEP